ncbi:hypothetical protein MASR2M117_07970 [Paludibacter sp.]
MLCLSVFSWQIHAQALKNVYVGTSLPTTQGWSKLQFDNSMVWEQATKDLLVNPSELSAVATTALKLKANKALDTYGYPLYSQLGYYLSNTGFSSAVGYTVEFKAKVVNSEDGSFTVSGVGAGKGFRLEFSENLLTEHANVLDTARVLSTASASDGFHVYRVAVAPDEKVRVWRDGILLGSLPVQPFKLDNIFNDGGFENGKSAAEHGWTWTDEGKTGTLTVTTDKNYVRTGKYGLFVDKGFHKNEFVPLKPESVYDMTAWAKNISFPDGAWRDLNGWLDPAGERGVYFVTEKTNPNWKYYERLNLQAGGSRQRFIIETPTSDLNNNQIAYDDIHLGERITSSRIPANAVNLFPNGDFENPNFKYFPEGDPRNDTVMVNPDKYDYFLSYYDDWTEEQIANVKYDADQTPFWHPFWHSRVRTQSARQGNGESGNLWARGKHSLRYFNCFSNVVDYGTNFRAARAQGRNTPLRAELPLEIGKTYTFSFWYHFAQWGGDHLKLHVNNGNQELWYKDINNSDFPQWKNIVLTFTTTAENHTLRFFTENTNQKSGNDSWGDPGVLYFDDFFLFEGQPLPEYDGTHLFFGKQTSTKAADVEIEYIKIDKTGAYAPDGSTFSSPYTKKNAALMTVWGENLQANQPILNEYPRPQLKREGWTNLNGIWDYTRKAKDAFGTYVSNETYRQQILVPFPVESALSGIMDGEYNNQNKVYVYKRIVNLQKPASGKLLKLNFGAIDWHSIIFVNGTKVAEHKGGFDPFSIDVTSALVDGSNQEIVVHVYDPTRGGQPTGKQSMEPGGTSYTPATGIWQTVWTEVVNSSYITDVQLTPVNNAAVKVKVIAEDAAGATATVKVYDGLNEVASADVNVGSETSIAIANAKLWSPETPFLYNVKVELKKGGSTTDNVTSYFGMRKVEVKKLRDKPYIYLNDKPQFSYAALDHGYFPDGILTPASYAAFRHDLSKLKELGFNAVRKFEKIEPAIWYHMADSMGMLVWQDIPAAFEGTPIAELNTEAARKANFLRETAAMTASIRNFPSIIAWIGFNDGWGRYGYNHVKNTVDLFRGLKDGRLVVPESGDDSYELGDVVSSLGLPIPTLHANPYNERASICGVTGNYNYVVDGHIWNTSSSSDIKTDAVYAERLKEFTTATANLSLSGISGVAMVQTTDCENEINGLMTYDRKVYKFAGSDSIAGKVIKDNTAFMKSKIVSPILKTSGQGGEMWKYLTGSKDLEAPTGWNTNMNFDDSEWLNGRSAFGGNMGVPFPWNTYWRGDNLGLFLRKKVNIPVLEPGDKLQFTMFYDEDYEFYINGVLAHANTGWSTKYVNIDIYPEALAAINFGGDNLFAIHVIQNSGGSCMDLGVTAGKLSNAITYEEPVVEPVWKNIASAEDWMNMKNDLNGFYRLTADINMLSVMYEPIGNSSAPFKGYVDGQNHTVVCPEINGGNSLGLFGYADGAHFVNLRFTDAFVSGGADVGVLLGRGKGVTVEHVVFDKGDYDTEVYGRDHVGTVAGMLEKGKLSTIKDVYVVNGKVESTEWQASGLVGIICDTRVVNSYYTGTVAISRDNRLDFDNADAGGIVARTEGGKNFFTGVMSLATDVLSGSGNEFIAYNGGGYIVIDSTSCFVRNDMNLDALKTPNRGGQFTRATESMKRPVGDFKTYGLYRQAGWDMTNVWGIPKGGGFPIFRSIQGAEFEVDNSAVNNPKNGNDLKVYSVAGNVVLSASQLTSVWIYNLQGALVERTDVVGTQTMALPKGIYIVKSAANGQVNAVKIINK